MSWPKKKLNDLCQLLTDGTHYTPPDIGKGIPFLTVKDMTKDGLDLVGASKIAKFEYDKADSGNSAPKSGDVLFSKDGTVGKVHVVKDEGQFAVLSSIAILRPKTEVLSSEFLGHVLRSPIILNQANKNKTGSALRRIILKDIRTLEIPLPPLAEQKRIAAILDKADALRRKRQQAIDFADQFLRSVFLDMFGDPVTNPKGWLTRPLKDMSRVVTGNTPSRQEPENYGSSIEWIKSDNINTPDHYLTEAEEFLSDAGLKKGRSVPRGSVLITCIAGSPQCIGNAAIADREVSFNQQINALVPEGEATTEYLYSVALFGKKLIQSISTNAMKGMVSKGNLEKLLVPAPPLVLQEKYSETFKDFLTKRKLQLSSLSQSESLFLSLSQQAFSGQL